MLVPSTKRCAPLHASRKLAFGPGVANNERHNKAPQTDERCVLITAQLQVALAPLVAERQNRSADKIEEKAYVTGA